MKREAASFLNLDLELNSATSLSRLGEHLERSAFVLYSGRAKGGYRLCAEPLIRGNLSKSPRTCTSHFLSMIEALPKDLFATFNRCKSRVFDYGFDGGLETKPLSVNLAAAHLARLARLGIQVRITIYPYRSAVDA